MAWSGNPPITRLAGNPGDEKLSRSLVRLPKGFDGIVRNEGAEMHVIVITGRVSHEVREPAVLEAGSYFGSTGVAEHRVVCDEECLLYVRTDGKFTVTP